MPNHAGHETRVAATSSKGMIMRSSALGGVLLSSAVLLAACGGGGGSETTGTGNEGDGKVTLTWWHNATEDPLKSYFQEVADAFTAENPDVTFKVEAIQNETIQTKIPVALQSNNPPDIFQQWGGGELASQVESGKVMDLTEASKATVESIGGPAAGWQVEDKQYGLPYSVGVVGFWYRTDLFKQAGIDKPPQTMEQLNDAVGKLKDAGIAPIALGGKDEWPDAFYFGYLATRMCSKEALEQATADGALSDECFTKAGEELEKFIATDPFNKGALGTPAQQGAASSAGLIANGKAAMELQGHWNGGVITGLTPDKKPLGDKLGWFPFPSVEGGAGTPDMTFGGGDGFSCSATAPPECADFLNFLLSAEQQKKFGALNVGLPVAEGSSESVKDPTVQGVLEARDNSSYTQLYFDKALPTGKGAALNDAVANMFAGEGSPDELVSAVETG